MKGKSVDRYKIGIICMFQILEIKFEVPPQIRVVKLPLFDRETSLTRLTRVRVTAN